MTRRFSKILITGGAGFIGSHIVDRMLDEGSEVTVFDDLSSGQSENLARCLDNKNFHFVKGDIRDWNFVKRNVRDFDAVFHEAALVSVARSIEDPLLTNQINVDGTLNVLKEASDSGVKRLVFASSAAVYGDTLSKKISEDHELNPLSPYGLSKSVGELYARYFYDVHGLETVSLRYFNVFGPRQSLNPESQYSGVISVFLDRLSDNLSPTIFGDGEQTRDFVFVDDVVEANMLALTRKQASGEVLNIGSGRSVSINQVAETLKIILNKGDLKNNYVKPRPSDIRDSCADISKAQTVLGYRPRVAFDQATRRLAEWYSTKRSCHAKEASAAAKKLN